MRFKTFKLLLVSLIIPAILTAQVKIGYTSPVENKAILELKDTTRGLLLPRMTSINRNAIVTPPDGLLVYDSTQKSIYQYRATENLWMPVRSDSSEWFLDAASNKLYLRRGLAAGDSIYYNPLTKHFIFGDTRISRGTTGNIFNLDEGNSDKFIFHTTASKLPRSVANLNSSGIYAIYDVDNDPVAVANPYATLYTGIGVASVVNPTATQKILNVAGISVAAGHAGLDTLRELDGVVTNVYSRGSSFIDAMFGVQNFVQMIGTNTANVGEIYGNYTSISYSNPATTTKRVLGNIYGDFVQISSGFNNKVDGAAYGLFMQNVRASSSNANFALYTLKGANHLGDSTVITDGAAYKPRAVLDVLSTTGMIIPVGNTAQRPATVYPGMIRYNDDITSSTIEVSTGTIWKTMASVISTTVPLDPSSINSGATGSVLYSLANVAFGNTVTVSPDVALPSGYFIAWARVAAPGQIEIAFGNISGAAIDLTAQNFVIKIVQ